MRQAGVFLINKAKGNIIWKLGGTAVPPMGGEPVLKIVGDPETTIQGQHDARFHEMGPSPSMTTTRSCLVQHAGVKYSIDQADDEATMVWEYVAPSGDTSKVMGSARRYDTNTMPYDELVGNRILRSERDRCRLGQRGTLRWLHCGRRFRRCTDDRTVSQRHRGKSNANGAPERTRSVRTSGLGRPLVSLRSNEAPNQPAPEWQCPVFCGAVKPAPPGSEAAYADEPNYRRDDPHSVKPACRASLLGVATDQADCHPQCESAVSGPENRSVG